MTAPLARVTAALEAKDLRPRPSGSGFEARCPAHEDRKASLSVSEGDDGKVLLRCFAGCETPDVVAALGLSMSDLFPEEGRSASKRNRGEIVARYPYRDEAGALLFEVVRFAPKDFRQRRPDPQAKGGWVWKLDGVRRVLYRLPEVLSAVQGDARVYVVEGEKDAENLARLGLCGTCNPGGAGKWLPGHSEALHGAHVVILPDADEPGRKHGEAVAAALHGVAASVRVARVPRGKDVSDWITAGATREAVEELADGAPAWEPGPVAAGEDAGPRESAAKTLIRLGERYAYLFKDERGAAHAAIGNDDARSIVPLRSGNFSRFLAGRYYLDRGTVANGEAIAAAKQVLGYKATFEGPRHPLFTRFARHEGALWIDLADEEQRAVRVTPEGWTIERPPILFRRLPSHVALPAPRQAGDVKRLLDFVNVRHEEDQVLLLAWLVTAVIGDIPRPILALNGPQGAAKTTAAKMLRRLTDPSASETNRLSANDADLALTLETNAVPLFDNVVSIRERSAELLCQAVTGGGFSKRELFTDSDEVVYTFKRAVILTGIPVPTDQPDLLDRFLLVQLDRVGEENRVREDALWRAFNDAAPGIFGGLLNALSAAMRAHPRFEAELKRLPRMADFATWGAAVSETLGYPPDLFLDAYRENVSRQADEVFESDPVARAVRMLVEAAGTWTGTATELLSEIQRRNAFEASCKGWPRNPKELSTKLRTLHTTLADAGVAVAWTRTGKDRTRTVSVSRAVGKGERASAASATVRPAQEAAREADARRTHEADASACVRPSPAPAPSPLRPPASACVRPASAIEPAPEAAPDAADAADAVFSFPTGRLKVAV